MLYSFFYSSNMSLSLPIVQYEPTHYLNPFHSDSVRARSNSYSCINGLTVYNCKTTECFFLSFLCCDKSAGFVCPFCTRGQIKGKWYIKYAQRLLALCNADSGAFWGVSHGDATANNPVCKDCRTPAALKVLTYTHTWINSLTQEVGLQAWR